jgi:hypothetical protein
MNRYYFTGTTSLTQACGWKYRIAQVLMHLAGCTFGQLLDVLQAEHCENQLLSDVRQMLAWGWLRSEIGDPIELPEPHTHTPAAQPAVAV